ncbi:S-layer homology domain-containing protein [Paenibacillus gorillae]|uniref:S-layer homology domain-containing protein n=1 Tax=Paenibacillus gorillae TaxID=1243662 RepID=UPI0004BA8FB5|nr:S-layer homology domain-containing protein [Paenibacillus gorillae]
MSRKIGKWAVVLFALTLVFHIMEPRLSAAELMTALTGEKDKKPFDDIAGSFAEAAIIRLNEKKILQGTAERTFSPKNPVTRAEFITIADRVLGLEKVLSPIQPFSDVAANAWYTGYIQAAVQLGLADGTGPRTFEPSKPVTRQEAAALLVRVFKLTAASHGTSPAFIDANRIAEWARSAVTIAQDVGLMKGDDNGKFRPDAPLSREETAAILYRALQNKEWAADLTAKPKAKIQLGWQYAQTTEQFEQSVLRSKAVNTLSPRWYFTDKAGNLTDTTDSSLVTWASRNGKAIWAMVGNRSNMEATHQLLSNATTRNKLATNLANVVQKNKLAGLNVDFENVDPQDRVNFTAFITLLGNKLHAINAVLSVNVSPDLGTDWTEAFDYKALGMQADYIVMMGYDEHWEGGSVAGSVASLPYVEQAVTVLLKAVSPEKVILALPFYNRDWAMNNNGSAASSAVLSLGEQNTLVSKRSIKPLWNSSVGQYTGGYLLQNVQHRIWLEDGRSLSAKYKWAVDEELAGLAYWYVGGETSDIWSSLRNADRFYGMSLGLTTP